MQRRNRGNYTIAGRELVAEGAGHKKCLLPFHLSWPVVPP